MKKQKGINKNSVIIISIVLIYGLVTMIFIYKMNKDKEKINLPTYLILNGEDYYEYSDNQIKSISFDDTDYSDILFNVYVDDEYKGEFEISSSTSSYEGISFINQKDSYAIRPNFNYIAITKDISFIDYHREDFTNEDVNELIELLANKDIYDIGNLETSYKVSVNVDKDEQKETIYVANNYDYENIKDNLFSIIYIKDNEEITVLEEYYCTAENYFEFVSCDLEYILDIEKNGNYTIVISNSDYDITINNFYIKNGTYYKNMNSV